MPYIITGTLTYSSQANRDAALSRITTALTGVTYSHRATPAFPAGVSTPTTTTITISIEAGEDGEAAGAAAKVIYDAAVSVNRHTLGYLSVNKVSSV